MATPVEGKVKNLGVVAAMVWSASAPSNQKILWYDTSVTSGCPIKYYNLSTQSWELLKG